MVKNQIVEVFLRLFCTAAKLTVQPVKLIISLQSVSTNFLTVDNCQLSTVQLWSIFKLGHTWHVYCLRWHCSQKKKKTQWVILTKETRANIHLTQIHNYVFEIKANWTILCSSIILPGIYQTNITTFKPTSFRLQFFLFCIAIRSLLTASSCKSDQT